NYSWRWIFFINIPIGILALVLSSRLVKDPPAFDAERAQARRNGGMNVDGVGIALVALASAALEVTLDRGQIDDWFGSAFICWTLAIAVAGWMATVLWEMRRKEPVIDFRLLGDRNFAIASVLFFVFGFGLFGSTTLIPQMLQSLYGYRAIDAGLVLGPGALVITVLAPIVARLIQRRLMQPRVLVAISLAIGAGAMWYYGSFNLATDYRHYLLARSLQGLGYGFFFVPVSIIAYSRLRPDQNNKASSLTNLFRNWGGSFGIAFITTASERRHQFHQTNLAAAAGSASQQLADRAGALTNWLIHSGFSGPDAATAAHAYLYQQLQHQVSLLAFMDCFQVMGWMTLAAVPLMLLVRHFKAAGNAPAAH
ncbi:MAG: DHA2 family efflux MFS transporter permease subunit, partial [Bryobacteraceae bacterium]